MTVREFLRLRMGVIDTIYLEHEAGVLNGRCRCRCGYQASEPEWLIHVADKIADALDGEQVVELPALFEASA
jgi:hypothetical protein